MCGWSPRTSGQHRDILPLFGIVVELLDELLHQGIVYLLERLLDRKGHRGIVDVLGSEAEMNKLFVLFETAHGIETLLDKILHGLHVVVGYLLNVFHPLGISRCKLAINVTELVKQ